MLQRKYDIVIKNHYPEARSGKDISVHYLGLLNDEHGIEISKVLMATSICSDDLNAEPTQFFNVLFGPFNMGGLAGHPWTGLTGMTAFSHHIPDGGAAFIMYGPHIGITLDGNLGKVSRPRMENPGNSCGALLLALSRLQDPNYKPSENSDDQQQMSLEAELLPRRDEIVNDSDPIKKITDISYELTHQKIHKYLDAVKGEFSGMKVALLGGVIINTPHGLDDYFDTRDFEVVQC